MSQAIRQLPRVGDVLRLASHLVAETWEQRDDLRGEPAMSSAASTSPRSSRIALMTAATTSPDDEPLVPFGADSPASANMPASMIDPGKTTDELTPEPARS